MDLVSMGAEKRGRLGRDEGRKKEENLTVYLFVCKIGLSPFSYSPFSIYISGGNFWFFLGGGELCDRKVNFLSFLSFFLTSSSSPD